MYLLVNDDIRRVTSIFVLRNLRVRNIYLLTTLTAAKTNDFRYFNVSVHKSNRWKQPFYSDLQRMSAQTERSFNDVCE